MKTFKTKKKYFKSYYDMYGNQSIDINNNINMNQTNRSYYQLNTSRVPSLTPPKNTLNSFSKDKITKQVKEKAIGNNSQLKTEGYNMPNQSALFLHQQSAILSARKATINLSDSSDKLRKTSPHDKSPNNPRLSTLQKNKQISISQSQQAIASMLAKMQENDQKAYIQKQSCHNPEMLSTQKSTLNSREYTNSSKHRTDDYQKIQKENIMLQLKVKEMEQRLQALESINIQLLNLAKSCDCHKIQLRELEISISNLNYLRNEIHPQQIIDQISFTEQKNKFTNSQEFSEIKPQNLFNNTSSNQIFEQFLENHSQHIKELEVFKEKINSFKQDVKQWTVPSVLKALILV